MAHKVIKPFFDKTDNLKPYSEGDSYSHKDEDRIAFLVKDGYLQGEIKKAPKPTPKEPKKANKKKSDK